MLGHMGHEEIDKSIEKVIWSFKYPIHDSEKFDVPCESMTHKNSPKLPETPQNAPMPFKIPLKSVNHTFSVSLPPELNEIECNQCHGEAFIPCLECGGDGVIECIGCGGMGVVGEEEEECEVEEVEYEYAAEDSGLSREI